MHIAIYTTLLYSHTSHTHTLTCNYIPHCPLSEMLMFRRFLSLLQDDGGWDLVESSLANNKQLKGLILDGCDAFLFNIGKALTKNTSIVELNLFSESL